jgi:hypothetical protein
MKGLVAVILIIGSVMVVTGCKTAGGAAIGAGIGALAGDPATGAAIGAGVGLVGDLID